METQKTLHGYRLREIIYTGTMSQVWRAATPKGEVVALKVPVDKSGENKSLLAELRTEANVLQRLNHDNVIKLVSFHNDRFQPSLALEFFEGNNMAVLGKENRTLLKSHISWALIQICRALDHVHRAGYVHRDIKPGNILMSKTGEVKLIDFSLARKVRGWFRSCLRDRSVAGTRSFVAPEELDKKKYDHRADIYSLGVTMYVLLTGKLPFTADSARELAAKQRTAEAPPLISHDKYITKEADDLVLRMLAKNPTDRPASTAQILYKVQSIDFYRKLN